MSPDQNPPEQLIEFVEELKRRWVATIDALVDPLIFVNKDYTIGKANKALSEFSGDKDIRSMIGRKCHEIFADSPKPCDGCLLSQSIEKGQPHSFNLKDVRKKFFFEVSSQPVFDKEGNLDDRHQQKCQKQIHFRHPFACAGQWTCPKLSPT